MIFRDFRNLDSPAAGEKSFVTFGKQMVSGNEMDGSHSMPLELWLSSLSKQVLARECCALLLFEPRRKRVCAFSGGSHAHHLQFARGNPSCFEPPRARSTGNAVAEQRHGVYVARTPGFGPGRASPSSG